MTVAWKTSQDPSQTAAINSAKGLFDNTKATTGDATLTTDEFINGFVYNSTGNASLTTPTAAQIVAAIKDCAVGSHFFFGVVATSAHTVTLTGGSGVTVPAAANVVTASCAGLCIGVVTNATSGAEAVYISHVLAT
jgi:hypothetical protein